MGRGGCGRFVFKLFLIVVALVFLAGVCAGILGMLAYQHITQPGVAGAPVEVSIPEGASGKSVGEILARADLVEHELFFEAAIRLDKSRKPIKQGWYSLPRGLSPMELLHILQQGSNRVPEASEVPDDRKVTVAEGLSVVQMSRLFLNPGAFVAAASDPKRIEALGLSVKTLDGFLMPNTYFFDRRPTEEEVVVRMLAEFQKTYAALTREFPVPDSYDMLSVITIASLVEEEAKLSEERPKVAAVIYNRLKKGMPLQLDSTLQYALDKYGQRMLYEDREVSSPYNTYKNPGLPPGPISCPGADSIKAALRPADADYIYFVSNADGKSHTFSATEAEHLKAVRNFRKEIAPQRKALSSQ
jgi:UPF0755 protein